MVNLLVLYSEDAFPLQSQQRRKVGVMPFVFCRQTHPDVAGKTEARWMNGAAPISPPFKKPKDFFLFLSARLAWEVQRRGVRDVVACVVIRYSCMYTVRSSKIGLN